MSQEQLQRQIEAIVGMLAIFHPPGPDWCVEMRSLNVGKRRAVCETFGDARALAARAAECDAQGAKGTYFGLNPLAPHLAGWKDCRIKAEDVVRRRWLPIDCDSDETRPTGSNATDDEKTAGFRVLCACRDLLGGAGLRGVVVGDSGNGWHAAYPVDLPNDAESQATIKAVLHGLRERCTDPVAAVTPSTHDAPRIWKC